MWSERRSAKSSGTAAPTRSVSSCVSSAERRSRRPTTTRALLRKPLRTASAKRYARPSTRLSEGPRLLLAPPPGGLPVLLGSGGTVHHAELFRLLARKRDVESFGRQTALQEFADRGGPAGHPFQKTPIVQC